MKTFQFELPKDRFPYIVSINEPSIFTHNPMGVATEWLSWFIDKATNKNNTEAFPLVKPSEYVVTLGFTLMARMRQMIEVHDWVLPDEPPPMYLPFEPGYISLAWVIDTAKRDRMCPHEAVSLAMALKKQQMEYDKHGR